MPFLAVDNDPREYATSKGLTPAKDYLEVVKYAYEKQEADDWMLAGNQVPEGGNGWVIEVSSASGRVGSFP